MRIKTAVQRHIRKPGLEIDVKTPRQERLLSVEEVVRQIRVWQYSPDGRGKGKRVPIRVLAHFLDLSHVTVYDVVRFMRASESVLERLSWAIRQINSGKLCFVREKNVWKIVGDNALTKRKDKF